MNKIATHDSATGEKGQGLISWLVTPFAKTQSKTIKEQYEADCRMFDLRVKLINNEWKCAHGCWHTKRSAVKILNEINSFEDKCYVTVTYEGNKDNVYAFTEFVNDIEKVYDNIIWGGVAVKYGEGSNLFNVKFEYLQPYPKDWPASIQGFKPLDGRSWHILLPIPWLWKQIYFNKPNFNDRCYTFVDFL
jgi:hypothetical protein